MLSQKQTHFPPTSLHGAKPHRPLDGTSERAEGARLEESWGIKYPVVSGIFLRCSWGSPAKIALLVTSLLKRLLRELGDFRGKSLGQPPAVLI